MLVSIALNAQERSGDICVDVKCVRNTTKMRDCGIVLLLKETIVKVI